MARRDGRGRGRGPSIEAELAALRALDPASPDAPARLGEAARRGPGDVVAAVARVVEAHRLDARVDELVAAFERLRAEPAYDPGCRGKLAIVRTLHALDHWDDRVFVAGLRHVQREGWGGPGGGPPDDTAAELRGACGLSHAHFGRSDALDVAAELLADPERATRIAAATALGDAGRPDASALLRYKILAGDPDAEVLAACFESLFALARTATIGFALGVLEDRADRAEVAVLALGAARVAEAFEPIVRWCATARREPRHTAGYLGLALLRSEPATAYLLDAVRDHRGADAVAAARALATFADDAALRRRLHDAARAQADRATRDAVRAVLPDDDPG